MDTSEQRITNSTLTNEYAGSGDLTPEQYMWQAFATLRGDQNHSFAWTPTMVPGLVEKVVNYFTTKVEPDWIDSVIRRDPALYKHFGLAKDDKVLQAFLKGEITAEQLVNYGKIDRATLNGVKNEVKTYQGLHAVAFHHIAHEYYEQYQKKKAANSREEAAKDLLVARKISQGVRRLTAGIEIHPGAKIGKNFFIDHGTAAVIGETAEIGDNVSFYHNITLGAVAGKELDGRRHPKIGNNVTISNNVNILGPVTVGNDVNIGTSVVIKQINHQPLVIGDNSVIQDGVMVTRMVPKNTRVVGQLPALPGMDPKMQGELIIRQNGEDGKSKPLTSIVTGAFAKLEQWVAEFIPMPTTPAR